MNKDVYYLMLLAQMALEDLGGATITFFKFVYPSLTSIPYLSATEMGELAHMTPQAARKHVTRLEKQGYLKRRHARAWYLNEDVLRDRRLLTILRSVLHL